MNKRIENEKKFWEKQAINYDTQVTGLAEAYERTVKKVLHHVNMNSEVLEVACGTGIITIKIAGSVKKVTATDISPNMVAVAQKKATQNKIANVIFSVVDAYELPYETDSFDAILLFNALHVVKEPLTLLKELYRVLKPGGIFLTATDCYGEKARGKYRILLPAQQLLKLFRVVKYLHKYKRSDVETLIQQSGYIIVEKEVLWDMPVNYYIAANKQINTPFETQIKERW